MIDITDKDKKEQLEKYKSFQHRQTQVEQTYNVNRNGRPKSQQQDKLEGPRSAGKVNQEPISLGKKKQTGTNARNSKITKQ